MRGEPFDVVLDEYLRLITRTRPWTLAEEEAVLVPFAEWLVAAQERAVPVNDELIALARSYGESELLAERDQQSLLDCLANLLEWSARTTR